MNEILCFVNGSGVFVSPSLHILPRLVSKLTFVFFCISYQS